MTKATQAAINSRLKRADTITRARVPNDTYARSEYVMRLGSKFIHLASSLPVYDVTAAVRERINRPGIQPVIWRARGRLSSPTPIRALIELKTDWGRVLWP